MDLSSISSALYTTGTQNAASSEASSVKSAAESLSADSSEEEMKDALKTFESYFVEQILKEAKETFSSWGDDEDEDSTMSQTTDLYMDTVYQELSDKLVDDLGGGLTQQLYEQMRRNYGITSVASEATEDTADASEDMNATTTAASAAVAETEK